MRRVHKATCPGSSRAAILYSPQLSPLEEHSLKYKIQLKLVPLFCDFKNRQLIPYHLQSGEGVSLYKDDFTQFFPDEFVMDAGKRHEFKMSDLSDEELRNEVADIYATVGIPKRYFATSSRETLEKLLRKNLRTINDSEMGAYYPLEVEIDLQKVLNKRESLKLKEGKPFLFHFNVNVHLGNILIPYRLIVTYTPDSSFELRMQRMSVLH